MATKKSAGASKNGRDSNPRYLGVKLYAGERTKVGSIIVRQAGHNMLAGENTSMGKDYTIFAKKEGEVLFGTKRKISFNNRTQVKPIVHVK
ncbi:MAG TPA: 50S ribosomal protein L27 [Candidatus Paceibacterota bacterium]|nr:50S ribosomal protein L27 [Candidatus Paceibacterota bacterium]